MFIALTICIVLEEDEMAEQFLVSFDAVRFYIIFSWNFAAAPYK